MKSLLVAVALLAAGCVNAREVPCGDLVCPEGETCVAGTVCATADQLSACSGVAPGGTCSVGGGVGVCEMGVCVPSGCGNGVVDPGEACDDGNTTGGDGCSADCKKIEMCGDGVVDTGEQCDDGNDNPADGCDRCTLTTWTATALIGGDVSARSTAIAQPTGVAVDRGGSLYVSDGVNNRVLRIDPTGVVTVVAGAGTFETTGFSGDGGPATSAQLNEPQGLAIDGAGDLYIADTGNRRVREVDRSGVITTVAGGGPGSAGANGDGGPATNAHFDAPTALALDGLGDLYIVDPIDSTVRRVDTTGTIRTFAGTGIPAPAPDGGPAATSSLADPTGVAVGASGEIYISEFDTHAIRVVRGDGTLGTLAASFTGVAGVAVGSDGSVYASDQLAEQIVRVSPATGSATVIAGTGDVGFGGDGGPATSALLHTPQQLAVSGAGDVYVADVSNLRIRRVTAAGDITTVAGNGTAHTVDGRAATCAALNSPSDVTLDAAGNLYIADENNQRVERVDPSGVITTVAGTGTLSAAGDGGPAVAAGIEAPTGLAIDPQGRLLILDGGASTLRRIDSAGTIETLAGTPNTVGASGDGGAAADALLDGPLAMAVDAGGTIYIADAGNRRVRAIAPDGTIRTFAGGGSADADGIPATGAILGEPIGVAVGPAGQVYIADNVAQRVRVVDALGVITTVAGNGVEGYNGDSGPAILLELAKPRGVAVGPDGSVYISDTGNQRIRRVDSDGDMTTVAGGLVVDAIGDGGPAVAAGLGAPAGLAFDGAGNLYLADDGVHRIRRIATDGTITTVAGPVEPEGMGPIAQAHFADPRALVLAAPFTLVAGGASGRVQAWPTGTQVIEVVAGQYPQTQATGALAKFRDGAFGPVGGVAYDAATGTVYLTAGNAVFAVTATNPAAPDTWTIALLAGSQGTAGAVDAALTAARFRHPTGLYLDGPAHVLYVADTGNHAIRALDLSAQTTATIAGTLATFGFFGDGGLATSGLLSAPEAITRCSDGDLYIADTGNHRVRRVADDGTLTTVVGVGVADSSGEGSPASAFPIDAPRGLACDATGNLFVTSTTTVRLVAADAHGVVDGSGPVHTIYGAEPRSAFPASVTSCLTGLAIADATHVQIVDSCTGLLVQLARGPAFGSP